MARRRRPKLKQYVPDGPVPAFQVIEPEPGLSYWEVQISDFQDEYGPTFRCALGKWSSADLAQAGAGECAEARGVILVTRVEDGIPTLSEVWLSNGRQVFRHPQDPT